MDGNKLIQVFITVVSYYFFSREFFRFSAEIRRKPISGRLHFACFFFVYLWFFIASCLELPLVVNWFIFLILLALHFPSTSLCPMAWRCFARLWAWRSTCSSAALSRSC